MISMGYAERPAGRAVRKTCF